MAAARVDRIIVAEDGRRSRPWAEIKMLLKNSDRHETKSFRAEEMSGVIDRLVETYCHFRLENEPFIDTLLRTGPEPFKANVYWQAA